MRKYRCTNCDYKWESRDVPFECPKCHSAGIVDEKSEGGIAAALKKYWWILASAIAIACLIVILLPKNSTRVSVKTNEEEGTMTVKLSGKHAEMYTVQLMQDGIVQDQFETKDGNVEHTFSQLVGEYYLELMYMGTEENVKIRKFKNRYFFIDRLENIDNSTIVDDNGDVTIAGRTTDRPEISQIVPTPARIKDGEKYKIEVKLKAHGCTVEEAEFSLNNVDWQRSAQFNDLSSGSHKMYARNAKKNELTCQMDFYLDEAAPKARITEAKANELLGRIASSEGADAKARDEWNKNFPNATPVLGGDGVETTQGLRMAVADGETYRITNIEIKNGRVISVTVSKQ